jgi:hypothetical protein
VRFRQQGAGGGCRERTRAALRLERDLLAARSTLIDTRELWRGEGGKAQHTALTVCHNATLDFARGQVLDGQAVIGVEHVHALIIPTSSCLVHAVDPLKTRAHIRKQARFFFTYRTSAPHHL